MRREINIPVCNLFHLEVYLFPSKSTNAFTSVGISSVTCKIQKVVVHMIIIDRCNQTSH